MSIRYQKQLNSANAMEESVNRFDDEYWQAMKYLISKSLHLCPCFHIVAVNSKSVIIAYKS